MFGIRNTKSPTFLPQEKLLCAGQESVSQVQFEGSPIGIPVRDGVHDGIARHLVGPVLNHVPQHQRLVITQESLVQVGLDAAGDFLESVFGVGTLYFFEMTARSP